MGDDGRRLARKGLIRPVRGKRRYSLTPYGRRVVLFRIKVQARILRCGLQALDLWLVAQAPPPLRAACAALDAAVQDLVADAHLAA
jgi:hypothetical protein